MLKRGYSKRTRELYEREIRRYQEWLDGRKPSQKTAQEYLDHLEAEGKAPNTIAIAGNAIRAYFKGKRQAITLDTPSISLGEPKYITVEELYRILEVADTPLRRCLVTVLFDTALRISELLGLTVDGIDWGQGFIHIVRKGGREADVNISQKGLATLREWLEARQFRSKRVFANLARYDAWRLFKQLGEKAGVPNFTPHRLRHSRAVQALEAGVDLHHVQMMLGHVNISTTANLYARLRPAELKEHIPDW